MTTSLTRPHPEREAPRRPLIGETGRSALIVLVLGALTVLVLYAWIYQQQAAGKSAAAIAMPSMHMNRMGVFWSFPLLQAAGLAALIWAYLGLGLGLLESGGTVRWRWLPLSVAGRMRLHRHISLLVLGLIMVHILATAVDGMGDNLLTVLVPGQAGWAAARFAYNIGIIAFYLAILVGPTYYIRRRIGVTRWRILHRLAAIVYILSIWHALLLGADIAFYGWVRPVMWLLQIPLLLLFIRRLVTSARGRRRRPVARGICYATAAVGAAAIAGVLAVVVTGNSGFVTSLQF